MSGCLSPACEAAAASLAFERLLLGCTLAGVLAVILLSLWGNRVALVRGFILAMVRRSPRAKLRRYHVQTFIGDFEFFRFEPFWRDERVRTYSDGTREHRYRPPWWRPFNVLLHLWRPRKNAAEPFHDHPRWTITVVLQGHAIERTPWEECRLRPGSIVIRGRKAIHSLEPAPGSHGKLWTLFIVGRRNWPQNTFSIVPRGRV